ncbi:hypothetical protein [Haloarcula halophila]|uniref:hypothetical protein n=1 Tax=Haloarcula TaxID=2237 RepID=UPI0023E42663|nr:hypothetical protein [Halomicroarcula sp. DFY41]
MSELDDPEPISPADARKPDSDEPYRFACPDCGRQVYGHTQSENYRCPDCGTFEKDELVDRKRQ